MNKYDIFRLFERPLSLNNLRVLIQLKITINWAVSQWNFSAFATGSRVPFKLVWGYYAGCMNGHNVWNMYDSVWMSPCLGSGVFDSRAMGHKRFSVARKIAMSGADEYWNYIWYSNFKFCQKKSVISNAMKYAIYW